MGYGVGSSVATVTFGDISAGRLDWWFLDLIWRQKLLHRFEGIDQGWIFPGGAVVVEVENSGSETT